MDCESILKELGILSFQDTMDLRNKVMDWKHRIRMRSWEIKVYRQHIESAEDELARRSHPIFWEDTSFFSDREDEGWLCGARLDDE